jgi:hypothetical protein
MPYPPPDKFMVFQMQGGQRISISMSVLGGKSCVPFKVKLCHFARCVFSERGPSTTYTGGSRVVGTNP